MTTTEAQIEEALIKKLESLKYAYRPDIRDRAALEQNFRQKFEALNRVNLTEAEFDRLLEQITTADVFAAAKTLRGINDFTRDDGTPLNFTLVNIKDWCKNTFEVVNQLRINTENSHQRYDVILLINGVPVAQIKLKALGISPRRALEQIVEYSKRISMQWIADEGYNLNISRYISTAVAEAEIDLEANHGKLLTIEKDIQAATTKHNKFLKELGLPPLP